MKSWASKTGPATAVLVDKIMAARRHPEEGFRACMGVMRLGEEHGAERLEAAATRALKFNACSFTSIKKILAAKLDRVIDEADSEQPGLPWHENVRGGEYYH
jgi:transposase